MRITPRKTGANFLMRNNRDGISASHAADDSTKQYALQLLLRWMILTGDGWPDCMS